VLLRRTKRERQERRECFEGGLEKEERLREWRKEESLR